MQTISEMKPNPARMWDYVLGGNHNFAADREAVELSRKVYPSYEKNLADQRHFLQRAMTYMAREKELDNFIDFGSGLPTRGNVHEVVCAINPGAKVIYSDKDSIVVVFGQEILGDTPNVRYIYCEVEEPHVLLESSAVTELFGQDRQVGIGLVGVFLYVADEPLTQFFNTLYEWVDEGSYIAATGASRTVLKVEGVEDAAKKMSLDFYGRTPQETVDLIAPWKITEPGIVEGYYWGLPEDSPEIDERIKASGYSFVAFK